MKKCFVISPIGQKNSEIRNHSDDVFNYIIKPAMVSKNIEPLRADQLAEPGKISDQMFNAILNYDLCIAVLTDHNPNVFYELAIAQSAGRPVILLIQKGQSLPFDIKDWRCLVYDMRPGELEGYVKQLISFIEFFERDNWKSRYFLEEYGIQVSGNENLVDKNDLFISSPMTSLNIEFNEIRTQINSIIEFLRTSEKFNSVYYAGQNISNINEADPSSISVQNDLFELAQSKYYVLVYPQKIVSSVLVEAGYALALKKRSAYFYKDLDDLPYMLREASQAYEYVNSFKYKDNNDLLRLIKKYITTIFS